jgi:MFS family permease
MSSSIHSIDPNLRSRNFYEPFTANIAGFIVPLITGLLSACSSGLIIYIISNSQQKLSTTYHRLMAFMSFFDIVSSIFIALGTIMLPSDTIYKFAGPILGNDITCQIQGWLIVFGLVGATSLYASLAWYFVLKISFKLDANTVRRWIEPVMYCYTLILAIFVPTFYLYKNIFHPTPYESVCTIAPYPESCDEDEWYDWKKCTWGDDVLEDYFRYMKTSVIVVTMQFMIVLVCMAVILWTSIKKNNPSEEIIDGTANEIANNEDNSMNSHRIVEDISHTRVLVFQAMMYIGALFITWILTCVSEFFEIACFELDVINTILFPLQGFWNLLIFLYDKTYLIRHGEGNISLWHATKMIIVSPSDAPVVFLSNISTIETAQQDRHTPKSNDESSSKDKGSEYDDLSKERVAFSIPDIADANSDQQPLDHEAKSNDSFRLLPSDMPLNQKMMISNRFSRIRYLGNENRRYFIDCNGIRRTGEIEDKRVGRSGCISTESIDTPKGFVGDSIGSTQS